MTYLAICRAGLTALAIALLFTGCGSPPPAPRASATSQISEAESAISDGKSAESRGNFDEAANHYKRAADAIAEGKAKASETERSRLRVMDDEVRGLQVDLQPKQIAQRAAAEKAKATAATAPVVAVDPAAEKKKAEEEAKKAQAAKVANASNIDIGVDTRKLGTPKAEEEEPAPAPKPPPAKVEATPARKTPTGPTTVNTKDGVEEAQVEEDKPKYPKVPKGFPEINEASPPLQVVRVESKNGFAKAYFQVFNKEDKPRRIMKVTVWFKNKDQQYIPTPVLGTFSYESFRSDAKNPIDESSDAVTSGSHTVGHTVDAQGNEFGRDARQFVACAETAKAADIKMATIEVLYDDGTNAMDTGPSQRDVIRLK